MSTAAVLSRPVWQDQWATPTVAELFDPFKETDFEHISETMATIGDLERVDSGLIWYGTGWNWTMQYTLLDEKGSELEVLCYVVPNPVGPVISVPLKDGLIAQLPVRRLSKYVREGIRSAKRAVRLHWATWHPNNKHDMNQLFDLVRYKHKYTLWPKPPSQRNGGKSKS